MAVVKRLDDGSFCATVRGLRGVIAVGDSREACRRQLGEVVKEWLLVRVDRGLDVPALGEVETRAHRTR
jgi:predicted RNase H-like HicB family nuclease